MWELKLDDVQIGKSKYKVITVYLGVPLQEIHNTQLIYGEYIRPAETIIQINQAKIHDYNHVKINQ